MWFLRLPFVAAWVGAILATVPASRAGDGSSSPPILIKGHLAHPTRVLAKVKPANKAGLHASALAAHGLQTVRGYPLVPGLVLLDSAPPTAAQAMAAASAGAADAGTPAANLRSRMEALRSTGLFAYVEPDYLVYADATPTDAAFVDGTLWALRNTGQAGGTPGVDIDAVRAWDITTGSTDVIVAVIDSGIRYSHRDLATQMWRNSGEIPHNGIDDDQDGYVDDVFGIDAHVGSGDPHDFDGHGTHVAGTIGAAANNDGAHVGVAWRVRVMSLSFLLGDGTGASSDAIECINYAVAHGATILNASWGGGARSADMREAIEAAGRHGALLVAAAGNEGANNDGSPYYPGGYDLPNVIAVAAINRSGARASFSNYGVTSVHLGAPGESIYSTLNGGDTDYGTRDGTSMATAHVSGVAALVRAQFPGISVDDLRDRILHTTVATPALQGRVATGGRLNAFAAVTATGDGSLELSISPRTGSSLLNGRAVPIGVRVTDLVGVTGASVTGTVAGAGTMAFRDDGVFPDAMAGDSNYTATLDVPAAGPQLTLTVNAVADGRTGASRSATYSLRVPPANDLFAARAALSTDTTENGNNANASRESGEPVIAGTGGGASVWWTWTATSTVTAVVSTEGSAIDTVAGVYVGDTVDALTEIANNDDGYFWETHSLVAFHAVAGTTYQIAVDGADGAAGAIALKLTTSPALANDMFADRVELLGTAIATTGAGGRPTYEVGEPQLEGRSGSLWWTWTAPADGTARVMVPSTAESVLVFTGSSVGGLSPVPVRDADPDNRATFAVTAGLAYQIAVLRPLREFGSGVSLSLSLVNAPANDGFSDRTPVTGADLLLTGANTDATQELHEPRHGTGATGASLWWSWIAPIDGTAIVTNAGASANVCYAAYRGSELGMLARMVDGDPPYGRLAFRVEAGHTYEIAADGVNGYTGEIALRLKLVPTPANDAFADRAPLSGAMVTATGDNTGATSEVTEPVGTGYASRATLWWTWAAPFSGTLSVAGEPWGVVAVYHGAALPDLAVLRDSFPLGGFSRSVVRVTAGETYAIAFDGMYGGTGAVTLALSLVTGPANDMFADRVALMGDKLTIPVDYANATAEVGELAIGNGSLATSVWWAWTAPASGPATVAIGGNVHDADLRVFTGSAVASLLPVTETMVSFEDDKRRVFEAVGGTEYQISISSDVRNVLPVTLHVRMGAPPANDKFADRTVIVGSPAALTGFNVGATKESTENSGLHSVWWTWTAPTDRRIVLSTEGSTFDTQLQVFTGSGLGALTSVVSNDNVDGWTLGTSRVVFDALAGTVYQFLVNGGMGEIVLKLDAVAPPPNDSFAQPATIVGVAAKATGSNYGASKQPGETGHADSAAFASVWWQWTAPASGRVGISTYGSDFNTRLGVYTGDSVALLTWIAENSDDPDGGKTSRVIFDAVAGTTYRIAVDGYSYAMGTIALSLSAGPAPTVSVQSSHPSAICDSPVALTASATGTGPFTYQWLCDGVAVPGATTDTLTFASAQAFHAGTYRVRIQSAQGIVASSPLELSVAEPPPSNARLTNLSTRALDRTGDQVLIPGFVIAGPGNKRLLIRGVGPTLAEAPFGLAGTLPNPRLALKRWNGTGYDDVTANDDWGDNTNIAEVITRSDELGAFPLLDASADAVLLVDLAPGQYSVVTDDSAGQTGIAIVELYDADESGSTSRLINISNRGYVGAGDNIMIPGFVISSEGPKTLLIRVVGPTLGQPPYNVAGVLADPTLAIYRHDFVNNRDDLILTNDDWSLGPGADRTRDVATQVSAFPLPEGSADAAFVVTLNSGVYTVHARGANDTEGVALVEVYAVP